MSKAQLVVANGGGYDAFMETLATDLQLPADKVITAVDTSPAAAEEGGGRRPDTMRTRRNDGAHEGHGHAAYNEHIWYDLESMRLLTGEIAARLTALDPKGAQTFSGNAAALTTEMKKLETKVADLHGSLEGKHFAMTEPVPFHLLEDLGMERRDPRGPERIHRGRRRGLPAGIQRDGQAVRHREDRRAGLQHPDRKPADRTHPRAGRRGEGPGRRLHRDAAGEHRLRLLDGIQHPGSLEALAK